MNDLPGPPILYLRPMRLLACLLVLLALPAAAQPVDPVAPAPVPGRRSGGAAFGLSLLAPGLGHRYARGEWGAAGTVHGLADVALWVGLFDTGARVGRTEDTYTALVAASAGTEVEGRDRTFFLNLARFESSEAYIDALLRARRWDQLEEARRPENQWRWASTADFERYRALRDDAEALRRRRPVYGALLAANRLLAGIGAIRAARHHNLGLTEVSLGPPPPGSDLPTLNLSVQF